MASQTEIDSHGDPVPEDEPKEPTPEPRRLDWNPLYDKLIVERLPEAEKLSANVYSADKYRKAQTAGVVLRVGDGRWIDGVLYPLTVKPGMTVLFSHYSGVPLEGFANLVVLREDEVLAWKEEEPCSST